ncbi:MAG: dihydrodipicolinate synthase family protein [Gemmataceae bacterium]
MPHLDLDRLATVQLVPPTPFTPDGSYVLPEQLARFVQSRAEAGISVFLPAAGTGEFHSLSADEVSACVEATRQAVPAAVVIAPVGLGIGHAVALARRATDLGADALLIMPPIHPYLSDSGFRDYFDALAATTPLPFLAYKKGPVPSDRLLLDLGRGGRLIGVKYAVNEMDAFARFAAQAGSHFGLYCGTAERFAPYFLLAGATGYTSGAGNVCPRLTLALHADLRAGRHALAFDRLRQLRPLEDFRARDADSFNITAIKAAVHLAGWDFGPPRPPQRHLTSAELLELQALVKPMLAREQAV